MQGHWAGYAAFCRFAGAAYRCEILPPLVRPDRGDAAAVGLGDVRVILRDPLAYGALARVAAVLYATCCGRAYHSL